MFVDEITIHAKAGNGGNGVERWLREQHRPLGGPAGGNGGKGGDVYIRAVRNINQLSKYTGTKEFKAQNGEHGKGRSRFGRNGEDLVIDLPIGSQVELTDLGRTYELEHEGETILILKGGNGGLGNEMFKSSVNRSPTETTPGKPGEESELKIELSLVVDVGIIGLPNAGKSTLLNALTNARSRVGDYPFTTLVPHLGDLYGFILADIPGLIEGASTGKGLGHTFLRHVQKTKMLLHCIALTEASVEDTYETVRKELTAFDATLAERPEWVVLTKSDCVSGEEAQVAADIFKRKGIPTFIISHTDVKALKNLADSLTQYLENGRS
jgi:GTP-binding protein